MRNHTSPPAFAASTAWNSSRSRWVGGAQSRISMPDTVRVSTKRVKLLPVPRASAQAPGPPDAPKRTPQLPSIPEALRGVNETAPFYALLACAQLLPFVFPSRGNVVDVAYFGITAISAMVIGCKRSPLQSVEFTAPLTKDQVFFAPVAASITLFGAYCVLRFTQLDIGILFNFLTTFVGGVCLKEALDPVFVSVLRSIGVSNIVVANIEEPEYDGEQVPRVYASDIISAVTAASVIAAYALPASVLPALAPIHYVFSNIIAIGIASRVLALIRPDSFLAAAGLLVGLCLYDIFFVFGTDVMVTVALKIDSPGKLLFPRDPAALKSAASYPFAVLGLGDVCVPGIFATLALALDAFLVQKRDPEAEPDIIPAGPYFLSAVAAYILGLGSCFGINFATSAAQPALLYLVPALISSTLIVATARGEIGDVVKFKTPNAARQNKMAEVDGGESSSKSD